MRATLTIIFVIVTKTASELCNYENSVELTNRSYNGIKYDHGEYFVDDKTGGERGCVCMKETCARKCCPFGQGYDLITKMCLNVPDRFNPPVWDESKELPDFKIMDKFHFLFYKMNCSTDENRLPIADSEVQYHLKTNGSLYIVLRDVPPQMYGPDKYCIDNFLDPGTNDTRLNALICFPAEKKTANFTVTSTCMLISCFFIILTVAVYAWIPELRNLHGMVLMAYLMSFFIGFLCLAIMQILITNGTINNDICLTMTFIIYYALLAAFFWMNVMSYDIWWTFSGKRKMSGGKSSIRSRFLTYSVYAFGMPTILTALLAILEFAVTTDNIDLHYYLPRIRRQGCFLYKQSKFIYLYLPIIVLCFANFVFFTLTAFKIAEIKKQTKVLNKKDKQRLTLYIKLYIVMGFNWVLEVISAFYDGALIFKFTDACNVLIGLFIFIIFVCKRKTFQMIKKRYRHMMGLPPLSRTQTTSTSISTRTFSKDEIQMNNTASK